MVAAYRRVTLNAAVAGLCCQAVVLPPWKENPWWLATTTSTPGSVNRELLPVWWLHVPKCGTSFGTALIHLACGSHIGENESIDDYRFNQYTGDWTERCGKDKLWRFGGHDPLQRHMTTEKLGHVAAMFREPSQRAISGWYHDRHDCDTAVTISDYAACTNGCAASMLLGYECFDQEGAVIALEKQATIESHMQALGFVGLTGEFDLSVCLLHAMYGGECLPIEFKNTRPGKQKDASGAPYDQAKHNITDMPRGADHILFEAAMAVFWRNIKKYGVNRRTCLEQFCPKAASFFEVESSDTHRSLAAVGTAFDYNWPGRLVYSED